jgi:hypothetical protein
VQQSEEEHQYEEDDDPGYDEIGMSQMGGAPEPTQSSQPMVRNRIKKKFFSPEGQRVPPPPPRHRKLTSKRGRKK